jgi:endoglucanase
MRESYTTQRRSGLTLPKRKKSPLKVIVIAMATGLAMIPIYHATKVTADEQPAVQVISPMASTVDRGVITLSFKVDGLSTDQYEPFWAVGNDQWNRMGTTNGVSTAEVDVTGWNWNTNNEYTFSFIALKKENWQPIIEKRTITINREGTKAAATEPTPTAPNQVPAGSVNEPSTVSQNTTLYVDPESGTQAKAKAWALSHPEDSNAMNKLTSQPLVNWYGGWNQDVYKDVNAYVTRATNAGQVPMLVAYNIPNRDCGSYSAGGVTDRQAYASWISNFARGIGNRDAIVLLEPDAIAGIDCLSQQSQADRLGMLRSSVTTLTTQTGAKVYIDAGNPKWQSTGVMADRLSQAGIAEADGFSLNVSNFMTTEDNITYGTELSRKTNGAHFVIDTSRNGNGSAPNFEWCNPTGVKIGANPTLSTGHDLVDAYLWIKTPGESDGTCGSQQEGTSAPAAGVWWPEYALVLLR